MATLPGLQKGITKDSAPPATDTEVSPITIPDGTTLLTTKLHNEIVDNEDQLIDYVSGDAGPNFIPQSAIDNLVTDLSNKQPLDSDLTEIAALVPANDDIIQRKVGAWTNRTPIEFKVDLALVKADVGLGNVDNTSDADKPVSTAQQTALDGKEDSLGFTPEDSANKGAISGYAALDASQELLLVNFPSGISLQVLRRNAANDALEFFTLSDLQGITSINGDTTAAQIIAAGTGLGIVDAGATHTLSIDATVATLTGVQTLTNKTIDGDLNTIIDINETQMTVFAGAAGTVLTSNGAGMPPTYQSAGTGDVVGPGSATDNAIVRFDTATGKLIQDGIITIDDDANVAEIRSLVFTSFTMGPGMSTTHIALVNTDFHINTTTGNNIQLLIEGVTQYQFDEGSANFNNNDLTMGTAFIQFSSITEPGVSGSDTVGRVFMDVANQNHLSIRRNGVSIDLQAEGVTSINADTAVAQTIAGTANRISLVDAGATHTFDIDSAYVGQTSITTLGTITTGVWNGTAITGANINAASTDLTDTAVIVLTNKANTWTIGLQDFSAVTLRIPVSATPSVTVDGDIAYDTTVTDFSTGLVKFFGTEEQGIVSMPIAEFTTPSDGFVVTYNATNDAFELRAAAGSGDMILAAVQTVTGAKTFEDTTLFLRNVADTFSASFVNTITADIIYTLPDAAGTVVITGLASQITLGAEVTGAITDLSDVTAKTGSGTVAVFDTSPTIVTPTIVTPTIASFVNATHDHEDAAGGGTLLSTAALSDTANIVYLNTANTYIAGNRQDFLGLLAGSAGLNVGGIAGNPTTQVNGDIWLNTATNQIFGRINGADIDLGQGGGTGLTSINGDTTPAQVIAAGTGLDIADVSNTHTLSIDSTVVTLIGTQTLTNKTIDGDLNSILNINETQLTVFAGAAGTVLTSNGVGSSPTYQVISPGDVFGPASATDNAIARFDTATGKLIQNGIITIDDVANVAEIRSLLFTSFTMGPGTSTTHIALVNTDFHINTTTGNNIQLLIEGVTQYQFDEGSANFNNNDLTMGTAFIQFSSITEPGVSGSDTVGRVFMDVANLNHLSIRRNGVSIDLEDTGSTSFIGFTADADLDMGAFDIQLDATQEIQIGDVNTFITTDGAQNMNFDIAINKAFEFNINSTNVLTVGANSVVFGATGTNMSGLNQLDFFEVAAPTSPGTDIGRLYVADVSGDSHIFFKNSTDHSGGVDLTLGEPNSFIGFTADANLDMSTFDITFDGTASAISGLGSGSILMNAISGQSLVFRNDGNTKLVIDSTGTSHNNTPITQVNLMSFGSANESIQGSGDDLQLDANTTGIIDLRITNTSEYEFSATQADFHSNDANNIALLRQHFEDNTAIHEMEANHTTPADGQIISQIDSIDDNSIGGTEIYSQIRTLIQDPTSLTEDGEMFFAVIKTGTLTDFISLNEADNDQIQFKKELDMNGSNIDMGGGGASITDVSQIRFITFGTTISQESNDLIFDVTLGNFFSFDIDGVPDYTFSATQADFIEHDLINVGNLTLTAGGTLSIVGSGATGFIDIDEITTPANPATDVGRLYVKDVSTVTTLFFRDSAGTETNLLAGSATSFIGFEADAVLDMGSFDINLDTSQLISFDGATETQTISGVVGIEGGIRFDVPTDDDYIWNVNSIEKMKLTAAALTMASGQNIVLPGTLQLFGTTTSVGGDSGGLILNNASGDALRVRVDSTNEYIFDEAQADFNGNNLIDVGNVTLTAGGTLSIVGTGATGFIDIDEITTPANPVADTGRLYVKDVSTVTTLFFRDNAGVETNLLASGSTSFIGFTADAALDMGTFNIEMGNNQQLEWGAARRIINSTTGFIFEVEAADTFSFDVAGTPEYIFDSAQVDWNSNNIIDMGNIQFDGVGATPAGTIHFITSDVGGITLNVPTGDLFDFTINASSVFTISLTEVNFGTLNIVNAGSAALGGNLDLNNNNIVDAGDINTDGFMDFAEIATPANPAIDVGRLYVKDVSTVTTLFFRDSAGTETDLLAAGGAISFIGFTADADLDMGAFDINLDASQVISFDGATETQTISGDVNGIIFDVPTGDDYTWLINSVQEMNLTATSLNMGSGQNIVIAGGTLQLSGSAAAVGGDTGGLILFNGAGDALRVRVDSTNEYIFDEAQADFLGNNIVQLGDVTFNDSSNLIFNATTGTKIGTATTQKIGFWDATPVVQPVHIVDALPNTISIQTAVNAILAQMADTGLQASA